MSGLELVSAMREEATLRDVPVVILTHSNDEADRRAAHALNVDDYIVKSASHRHLDRMVAWLRGYRAAPMASARA
jgi:DNA-binding response OmpR family regulator